MPRLPAGSSRRWAAGAARPEAAAPGDARRAVSGGLQVDHLEAEAIGEPLRDERAVAGLRGGLHAHQRADAVDGQAADERLQGHQVENLLGVLTDVLRSQPYARPLADALAVILAVLEMAELGVRRQLRVMLVADVGIGQQSLESLRVGPRVLRSANAPALTDVDQLGDAGAVQGLDEAGGVEVVDADGGNARHDLILSRGN